MKTKNSMKIIFPSISQNEYLARSCVCAFAAQSDPTVSELNDIRSAVSEAVTNAIVHGYGENIGFVELSAKVDDELNLYIKIKDKGVGIEDIKKAMEPMFTTKPEEDRAGLGFAVMTAFMDKVTVKSAVGKGTTITLKKKLSARQIK